MNHTKGEWKVEKMTPWGYNLYCTTGKVTKIHQIKFGFVSPEEADEIANLIAAAPALLEACERLLFEARSTIEIEGDCDHDVNICICGLKNTIFLAERAIAQAVKK